MKVRSDVAPIWSLQKQEFLNGGQMGQDFVQYIELWCEVAERLYEQGNFSDGKRAGVRSARDCLLDAMKVPEGELGQIDGTYLGPMLMYIIHAWEHGEELGNQLSPIELKIVASAIEEQTAHNQARAAAAAEAGNAPEPPSDTQS